MTTTLTAAVLYQYGTGPVAGFAVTLIAGLAASLFTRDLRRHDVLPALAQPLARRPDPEHLNAAHLPQHATSTSSAGGAWPPILTAAFILAGLAMLRRQRRLNYSIEFTGGTLMQLEFTQPPDVGRIRSTLDRRRHPGAEIQQFGSRREFMVRAQDATRRRRSRPVAPRASRRAIAAALDERVRRAERSASSAPRPSARASATSCGATRRIAMLIASLVTLVYLAIRFEWRFGLAAVLATAHDILATFAFIKLLHIEVSLTVVAAILTLLGYSVQRHDHHLRSRAREPARRSARRRCATCSTARSTRRCRARC